MRRTMRWMTMMLVWTAMVLSGCASDDIKVPEAELTTPGAFIAVRGYLTDRDMTLIRTIDRLDFEFETLLFFSIYDVAPKNWEEARDLAQQPNLPLEQEIDAQPTGAITQTEWDVVWFRTLTVDEQRRVK